MEEYDLSSIFRKKFVSKGLKSLLNQVLKDDIDISIAIMTGYQSDLTKTELIDFYVNSFDSLIEDAILSFHSEIIILIKQIIENEGEIEFIDMDPRFALLLKMYFIAFPVVKDQKNVLVMSNEIYHYLKSYNFNEIQEMIELNDLVTQYSRGLISCYGAFEVNIIFDYIKEYEGLDLDKEDFFLLLNNDSFLVGYDYKNDHIIHYQIQEIRHFNETREKYQDLDYYHLTQNDILNGFELSEEETALIEFYEDQLDMPHEMAEQGLYILLDAIQLEMPYQDILDMLKQLYISPYERKRLEKLVENLAVNTRLWSLKGHTQKEVKIPKMIRFPKLN